MEATMASSKDFLKRDDVRGLYPSQLNGETAKALGQAICALLQDGGCAHPVFAVGHDCRHGNTEISQGFMLGVLLAGGVCDDLGLVSTEHVYYACGEKADRYDAGAMVTASHNPKEYNGIKFIHKGCLPFSSDELQEVGRRVDRILGDARPGMDFAEYARHLVSLAGFDKFPDAPKDEFTVLVLAGNGMGGVAFSPIAEILAKKGLHSIILEDEPNGDFPNGVPNPLLPGFMSRLSQKVLEYKANLGIGFDGDADRAGFVDAGGNEIIPSHVLALIGSEKLSKCNCGNPVIMRNLCCSQLLFHLFEGKAEVVQTPVGHGRIKQLMRCDAFRDRAIFAGEHSGHYFYPEFNYVDSGVLTSLYMISLAWGMHKRGEALSERLGQWRDNYCWSGEINYTLPGSRETKNALMAVWKDCSAKKLQRYEVRLDQNLGAQRIFPTDGAYEPDKMAAPDLKMVQDNGGSGWWFVLRPSGNEPKLRLNVEAWGEDSCAVCKARVAELEAVVLGCGAVRQ